MSAVTRDPADSYQWAGFNSWLQDDVTAADARLERPLTNSLIIFYILSYMIVYYMSVQV